MACPVGPASVIGPLPAWGAGCPAWHLVQVVLVTGAEAGQELLFFPTGDLRGGGALDRQPCPDGRAAVIQGPAEPDDGFSGVNGDAAEPVGSVPQQVAG